MTSRPLSSLLALALLPYMVAAPAAGQWECGTNPDGIWECVSKAPPQMGPPAPAAVTTDDLVGTTVDPVVAPEPAATENKPEAGIESVEAITAPETTPATPPETDTQSGAATEPTASPIPVAADTPSETATSEKPVAAPVQSVSRQIESNRWALCPPAPQSTVITQTGDDDTIDLQADNAQASDGNVFIL